MGKKVLYKGIKFDSNEQICFYQWCQECLDNNIIKQFYYQPDSFMLSQKILNEKNGKILLRQHKYTTDFKILFDYDLIQNTTINEYFCNKFTTNQDGYVYLDVKPPYNKWGSITNFVINQKWVWQLYNIYVHQLEISQFFMKTFVPNLVRYTQKTHKVQKKYVKCLTIQEYMQIFSI